MLRRTIVLAGALVAALVVSGFAIASPDAAPQARAGVVTHSEVDNARHALLAAAASESAPIADIAKQGLRRLDALQVGKPLPAALPAAPAAPAPLPAPNVTMPVSQASGNPASGAAQPVYGPPVHAQPIGLLGAPMALGMVLGGLAGFVVGLPLGGVVGVLGGCFAGLFFLILGCPVGAIVGGVIGLAVGPVMFGVLGAIGGAMALSPVSAPVSGVKPAVAVVDKVGTVPDSPVSGLIDQVKSAVPDPRIDAALTATKNAATTINTTVQNISNQVSMGVSQVMNQFRPQAPVAG